MHCFNTVLNDAEDSDRTTPVRVQCEAQDCRALLEVNVSPGQRTDRPVIVRCGSCKRLLEVDLAQARLASINQQQHHSSNIFTGGSSETSTAPFRGSGDGFGSVSTGGQLMETRYNSGAQRPSEFLLTNASKLRPQALLQPPPLSRYIPIHHKATQELPSDLFSWYAPSHYYGSFLGSPMDPFKSPEYNYGAAVSEKTKAKKQKASKVRHPSPYNMFMSEEVKRIKAMNPSVDHKEAFRMAASNWAKSPLNCSNRRMPSPFKPSSSIANPFRELEAGVAPMENNVSAQRLEFESKVAMSNFKRHVADLSPEDSANNEKKRRKTDLEFLETSKKSNVLSDIIKEGEVV